MYLKKHSKYALSTLIMGFIAFLTLRLGIDFAEQTKDPDTSGSLVFLSFLALCFLTFYLALMTFFSWVKMKTED